MFIPPIAKSNHFAVIPRSNHTHHYYTFDLINWLSITIALCIVVIQMTSFGHPHRWMSKLRAFIMVLLIGGPIIYFVHILQERY